MYLLVAVDDRIHDDNHRNLVRFSIPFHRSVDIDSHDNPPLVVRRLSRLDSMHLVAYNVVDSLVAGICMDNKTKIF